MDRNIKVTLVGFYTRTHKPIIRHMVVTEGSAMSWIVERANVEIYYQYGGRKMPPVCWVTVLPGHHDRMDDWEEYQSIKAGTKVV